MIKKIKLEKNIAGIKVNHSAVILDLSVTFLMQLVKKHITKQDKELAPSGVPMTTSLIIPARKICPIPK